MPSAERARALSGAPLTLAAPGGAALAPAGNIDHLAADAAAPAVPDPVPPTALVTAGPIVTLLDDLADQIRLLRALTPRSDVPDALAHVATRLRAALAEAAAADVWVTIETAARARGLSASAVRWRINRGRLRAEWRGGRWWIHRADVEAM